MCMLHTRQAHKGATNTWDVGANICPMSTLEVAPSHFSPYQKNGTRKMANSNGPHIWLPMLLQSQGEDTRGHTLFDASLRPLSKSPLTFDIRITQSRGEHPGENLVWSHCGPKEV